jgi:cobaltochelatase CobT
MEAVLAAQETAFDFDARLADLRTAVRTINPQDLVIALLIDQSGSMKGSPIAFAGVAATLLADLVDRLGARTEILGFSTAGWRGGNARARWLENGRPARPGRLCALMHVIYKSADESTLGAEARRVMVHPDLLRENVDGEALLWARDRLIARPERHKLLIVVSDGAPVDDSTLQANGPSILHRHIMKVVHDVEAEGLIVGGVGINHRVEAYYFRSVAVTELGQLPDAMVRVLEQMLRDAVPA